MMHEWELEIWFKSDSEAAEELKEKIKQLLTDEGIPYDKVTLGHWD